MNTSEPRSNQGYEEKRKRKIAVIIPVFNEEKTIYQTIIQFRQAIPDALIVVVDNNSNDKTLFETERAFNGTSGNTLLSEKMQGKGYAIRTAFANVDADVYLLVDGDLTYPATQSEEMIAKVLNDGFDMVVGDRLSSGAYKRQNTRRMHGFGNRLVATTINLLFKAKISDPMSGFRALSARLVKTYAVTAKGFELETDLTLHVLDKNLKFFELPIDYKDRPQGSTSKLNTFSDGFKVLTTILNIFRFFKPLQFFSWACSVLLVAGFGFALPSISDYYSTGQVEHLPSAVLSVGCILSALLLFITGLILDAVASTARKNFELQLAGATRSIR